MKALFHHIGMPKAGSTYLQREFFPKHPELNGRVISNERAYQAAPLHVAPRKSKVLLVTRTRGRNQSLYRQYVKEGGFLPYCAWLDVDPPEPQNRVVARWARNHDLLVQDHKTLLEDPEQFFQDLCSWAGVSPWVPTRKTVNRSWTAFTVALARHLNVFWPIPEHPRVGYYLSILDGILHKAVWHA